MLREYATVALGAVAASGSYRALDLFLGFNGRAVGEDRAHQTAPCRTHQDSTIALWQQVSSLQRPCRSELAI